MLYRKGEHIIRVKNSPGRSNIIKGNRGVVLEDQRLGRSSVALELTDRYGATVPRYTADDSFIERLEIYKE